MNGTELIAVSKIRLDGGTQPRAALDASAIEDYAKAMSSGAAFPPVTVYYDGENYWVADGFHRVKAASAAALDSIECEVCHFAGFTTSAPMSPSSSVKGFRGRSICGARSCSRRCAF
jgi:uncharacterized ParB-like nuclease family protein